MSILIKNSRVITAEKEFISDIYIEKETISNIGLNINRNADKVIDASGKFVIPGGIDAHTHLDMPLGNISTSDDFETGTKAAAFGGTTTIIDFATPSKGMRLREAFEIWQRKAEGKSCIDYGFHMIIVELNDKILAEMDSLVNDGITSFKLFMAYPNVLMVNDETILKAMQKTSDNGGLICLHAEDGVKIDENVKEALRENKTSPVYHALTRPPSTEAEAVGRAVKLAEKAKVPVYIVHVSSFDALERIIIARDSGIPIFAETCPHYLFLSIDDLNRSGFEGAKYVLSPPLREKWHQEKLWNGLKKNYLQVVSTDHCSFNFKGQKEIGKNDFSKIPNGGPGIENRMELLFDGGVNRGRISMKRWVEITSTTPAKIFGIYPRKGTIAVGSDADIVIWDSQYEHIISSTSHHMAVDYSMYEGFKVTGCADTVISRGKILIENKKWLDIRGWGQYLKRQRFTQTNR